MKYLNSFEKIVGAKEVYFKQIKPKDVISFSKKAHSEIWVEGKTYQNKPLTLAWHSNGKNWKQTEGYLISMFQNGFVSFLQTEFNIHIKGKERDCYYKC